MHLDTLSPNHKFTQFVVSSRRINVTKTHPKPVWHNHRDVILYKFIFIIIIILNSNHVLEYQGHTKLHHNHNFSHREVQ